MSINMERFSSQGHFASYDPHIAVAKSVEVFTIQCRSCGFEPEQVVTPPRLCPKCHATSWERFARPGSILNNAERY
jgi:rubrerythrin